VDANNQNIQKFSDTGTFLLSWTTQGSWDTDASDPDGICVDKWGNVYTPDYNNRCVCKYSDAGTFLLKWGSYGTGPGQFGLLSCGICVDSNGVVYVTDYLNMVIDDFTDEGTYLCQWGNTGTNALGHMDYLCLSPSGKVYVEDNNTVKVFGP
jgi:tripartite motif-containing protein 71